MDTPNTCRYNNRSADSQSKQIDLIRNTPANKNSPTKREILHKQRKPFVEKCDDVMFVHGYELSHPIAIILSNCCYPP